MPTYSNEEITRSSQPKRIGKHLMGLGSQIWKMRTLPTGKRIWMMISEAFDHSQPSNGSLQVTEGFES